MKKVKEEYEKKMVEVKKVYDDFEKKYKELEVEVVKNKFSLDLLKVFVKFKDVLGRKFSFLWYICKIWKGMEGFIK